MTKEKLEQSSYALKPSTKDKLKVLKESLNMTWDELFNYLVAKEGNKK